MLEGRPLAVSSCGILSTKCSYPGDSAGGKRGERLEGAAAARGGQRGRGRGLLPVTSAPFRPLRFARAARSTRFPSPRPIGRRDGCVAPDDRQSPTIPCHLRLPPPLPQHGGPTNKNSSGK